MRIVAGTLAMMLLTGCAERLATAPVELPAAAVPAALAPAPPQLRETPALDGFTQCVPLARALSGIEIYGDAWTWWGQAAGRFQRDRTPRVGSVLALQRSDRLRLGHVGVVAAIAGPRELHLTHANWGGDSDMRGLVHERQPVIDVSPGNDWSQLRFMNRFGQYGRVYAAHGFIHPQPPTSLVSR